jgi:hypothetical protein
VVGHNRKKPGGVGGDCGTQNRWRRALRLGSAEAPCHRTVSRIVCLATT